MKTSELTGAALDWAVAECEGLDFPAADAFCGIFAPSTDWAQGGPIIEREGIHVSMWMGSPGDAGAWWAHLTDAEAVCPDDYYNYKGPQGAGRSPLIAAMRCYVASKLGAEIDIPKELT